MKTPTVARYSGSTFPVGRVNTTRSGWRRSLGTRFFKLAELERAKEREEVEREAKESRARISNEPTVATSKGLVLVAEDNPDLRRYISRLLQEASWEVKTCEHGRQALSSFRRTARMY